MTLSAGAQLGPYTIRAELGHGGMGVVYTAHDPRLDRVVRSTPRRRSVLIDHVQEERVQHVGHDVRAVVEGRPNTRDEVRRPAVAGSLTMPAGRCRVSISLWSWVIWVCLVRWPW